MTYTIHHESVEHRTALFTVKRVDLSLPDGKPRVLDLIEIQNAVTILPLDNEGYIHFVKQYRIGARSELLELPAGKIEDDEDPLQTAQRELREEIGMSASSWRALGNFYLSPGYASEYMYGFLAQGLVPDPLAPDADEFLNIIKVSLPDALSMVRRGEIQDSKTLAVLMLAHPLLP
jgi:ADP-ribose pyrophosphatase